MKTRTFLVALALVAAPTLAAANCVGHTAQTMSCAEGEVWDTQTRSCVPSTTS